MTGLSERPTTVRVMDYSPWRALRALGERVRLYWADLPQGTLALTDGRERIWIDPHQTQVQRRCTLAHELAHIELGHTGGCTPRDEADADALAARNLIPLQKLLDALRWSEELEEVAEELAVDMPTLIARLDNLTEAERREIADLHRAVEFGA